MINNQFYLFFIYILSGVGISILFDTFRVLRKSVKTSNIITYIEDFIFWIIVGIFLIWEIFTISYGELRSYIFIGLLLGIFVYMITISKYFIKINVKILDYVKKIIKKVILLIKKFLKLFSPLYKIVRKLINIIKINIKKLNNKINNLTKKFVIKPRKSK